jgi:hypothetical protein
MAGKNRAKIPAKQTKVAKRSKKNKKTAPAATPNRGTVVTVDDPIKRNRQQVQASVMSMMGAPLANRSLQALMMKFLMAGLDKSDASLGKPIVPRFANLGANDFFESVAHTSTQYDFFPVLAALNGSNVPTFGNTTIVPVFKPGAYPVVAFHDAYVVAVMPVIPTGNRSWSFYGVCYENGFKIGIAPHNGINDSLDLYPATCSQMPTGFSVRPAITRIMGPEQNSYMWVDSNTGTSIAAVNATIQGSIDAGTSVLSFTILKYEPDAEDMPVTFTNVSTTTGNFNLTFPTQTLTSSGYYRFTMNSTQNTVPCVYSQMLVTITITEYTSVATGFLLNSVHENAQAVSRRHWLAGSGLLISPKFPAVFTEGTILGGAIDPAYTVWYQATGDGNDALNRLNAVKQFGAGGGGCKLSEGVWMFGSPSEFPGILSNGLVSDLSVSGNFGQGGFSPIGHLLPADDQSALCVGMKMALLDVSGNVTSALMRFTSSRVIDYTTDTQLIAGSVPTILLVDEWGAATNVLARFPPMTTNDWHSLLGKISASAGRFATFLLKVAEGTLKAVPLVSAGAQFATELAAL